jgi:hypothetical protein
MRSIALVTALSCAAALGFQDPDAGPAVGRSLPAELLEDFAQTPADGLDDYRGRLLLVELFAYW